MTTTTARLQEHVNQAATALAEAEQRLNDFLSLTTQQRVAEELHARICRPCRSSEWDGCGWEQESWYDLGPNHIDYWERADRLLDDLTEAQIVNAITIATSPGKSR